MRSSRTLTTVTGVVALSLATSLMVGCGDDDTAGLAQATLPPARPQGTYAPATTAPGGTYAPSRDATVNVGDDAPWTAAPRPETQPLSTLPPDAQALDVNPTVDTEADPLSTFALDVDTGSFTLTRSYLDNGVLPDPETVRIEEFVNAFEQDYPVPDDGQFSIVMDGTTAPFLDGDERIVRVGIQARRIADEDRRDANLTFVVDISGSMADPGKLDAIRPALTALVKELRSSDRVAIVVYSDDTRVLLPSTRVDEIADILGAIEYLEPGGSTYAEAGLRLGYEEARRMYDAERINRVILLSDGVANVGETGPEAILEVIGDAAREGIDLVTVGFGLGTYNDTLMEQLADRGDGFYAYVDGEREAERLFEEDLTGTLQVVAREAKVQVEFNPATVASYRLVGFENRAVADDDFRDDSVDGGEIGAGHTVTALYEVRLTETPGDGAWLARTTLRWLDPRTAEATESAAELTGEHIAGSLGDASQRLQQDVYVAAFADHLRGGGWAEALSPNAIRDNLDVLAGRLDDAALRELVALVDRFSDLAG